MKLRAAAIRSFRAWPCSRSLPEHWCRAKIPNHPNSRNKPARPPLAEARSSAIPWRCILVRTLGVHRPTSMDVSLAEVGVAIEEETCCSSTTQVLIAKDQVLLH